MSPKRIGFLGFDRAAALNLVGPADAFSTAALDDGYGNRISCYEICTIGLSSEPFQAESGMIFNAQETIETAPELDTIVIPGGKGLRRSEINERIQSGYRHVQIEHDASHASAPASTVWLQPDYWMDVKSRPIADSHEMWRSVSRNCAFTTGRWLKTARFIRLLA
jgi:hypothetical protein